MGPACAGSALILAFVYGALFLSVCFVLPQAKNPWWASTYEDTFGAVFCSFNVGGDMKRGECYLKTIDNKVHDQFLIVSNRGPSP